MEFSFSKISDLQSVTLLKNNFFLVMFQGFVHSLGTSIFRNESEWLIPRFNTCVLPVGTQPFQITLKLRLYYFYTYSN